MTNFVIGALKGMTIVTPDLGASLAAYADYLGYRCDQPEIVGPDRARLWQAPSAASAEMAVIRPTEGGERFLRLVEGEPGDWEPFKSYGWAAVEIVVDDLDRVAGMLAHSPFRIIGPPAVLDFDFTDQIRAMQVEGPSREVLYLTEIGADIPGFDLPRANGLVGEPFIAVLGAPLISAAAETYASLGREAGPVLTARIEVLSDAHALPGGTKHRLTTIALADRSLIEIDGFPDLCVARAASSIGLPSGIAMASFAATIDGKPLEQSTLIIGAAGELIELLP